MPGADPTWQPGPSASIRTRRTGPPHAEGGPGVAEFVRESPDSRDVRPYVPGPQRRTHAAKAEADTYRGDEERPLGGYIVVTWRCSPRSSPAPSAWRRPPDARSDRRRSVGRAATRRSDAQGLTNNHQGCTSPLRAPFTRYEGTAGPAEVMEEVRSTGGLRHSIGELITCPFCLDVWISPGSPWAWCSLRA